LVSTVATLPSLLVGLSLRSKIRARWQKLALDLEERGKATQAAVAGWLSHATLITTHHRIGLRK
jgi:hypothetical protein